MWVVKNNIEEVFFYTRNRVTGRNAGDWVSRIWNLLCGEVEVD